MTHDLAIIGAGNMAEAIARGVIRGGLYHAGALVASDVSAARRRYFETELGIRAVERNAEAARGARRVLLSVKPQQMGAALAGLGEVLDADVLVISIAAGTGTRFIEQHLGGGRRWRVVRAMPN